MLTPVILVVWFLGFIVQRIIAVARGEGSLRDDASHEDDDEVETLDSARKTMTKACIIES